jgi:hypothetical protein
MRGQTKEMRKDGRERGRPARVSIVTRFPVSIGCPTTTLIDWPPPQHVRGARTNVGLDTPIVLAMTLLGRPSASISRATANFSAVMDEGRPPILPRSRPAYSPATVRSRMRSRSNAASEARMPNSSRPAEVVVSMASVSD